MWLESAILDNFDTRQCILLLIGCWFEVEPLPGDNFRITTRADGHLERAGVGHLERAGVDKNKITETFREAINHG